MRTSFFVTGVLGALIAIGSGLSLHHRTEAVPTPPLPNEAEIRDHDIAFYASRVARDPTGATDLARLASLYQRRARETGDYNDALRAEESARRSLRNRRSHNTAAIQILASSLLTQHRFNEAHEVTQALVHADSSRLASRAALGEIAMELGHYDEASALFTSLTSHAGDLTVAPRLARWYEIEGRTSDARSVLDNALRAVLNRHDVPREQVAWFWLRRGDLELRDGHPEVAAYAYHQGLKAHPGDYRILSAQSHLAAVQHHWKEAIATGEQAVAVALDPATLGTLSDAYAALGDTAHANEYAHVMEVAVLNQPGAYHRAWSLFLLDHNRRVSDVYAKAQEELATRQDIYGWDVLAWSLHKLGSNSEARHAMEKALAQHTQDAMLNFHAGMIARSLGDNTTARRELSQALQTNLYFHPQYPAEARAVLDSLALRASSE